MDGLNVVAPYADPIYRRFRPTIALPAPRGGGRDAALDLDGYFGLHPSLEPLLPLWKDGTLAAVQAVGSPDPTRSHFDAQDFMESGTPGVKSTEDGWINRHLQCAPSPEATPFRAVSLTPTLPRSLAGRAPAVAMSSIREFDLRPSAGSRVASGFEGMYEGAVKDVLHGTGQETFDAIQFLKKSDPSRYTPAAGVAYPRGRYGDSLKQVAQLLKADVGVEVAFTEIGGWDHHAAEGGVQGQLAQRLRELGGSLAAFEKDLGDRMQDVVVVTLTEFGRTVHENGNRGTDHGHASVSLVMGGGVRGGKGPRPLARPRGEEPLPGARPRRDHGLPGSSRGAADAAPGRSRSLEGVSGLRRRALALPRSHPLLAWTWDQSPISMPDRVREQSSVAGSNAATSSPAKGRPRQDETEGNQ